MFKQIATLFRGRSYEAAEAVVDRNAMAILRQQLRDCAQAVTSARRAVAVAIAQNEQEIAQHRKLLARMDDLEKRTVSALEQGKDDLAREAAETIALLDAERTTSEEAQHTFKTEIERLKKVVRESEARLRDLQRGERLAAATDKTQRLREAAPNSGLAALKDAEDTLTRLRTRQKQIDATTAAMDEMALTQDPSKLSERLAEAGCGAPLKTSADDVLARLSKKVRKTA